MATINSGFFTEIPVVWSGTPGAPYYSRFCLDGDDPDTMQDYVDAIAAFLESLTSYWPPALSWTIGGDCPVISITTGETVNMISTTVAGDNGTATDDQLPQMVQILTTLRTGEYVAGRGLRGRFYLPAPTEVYSDDGRFVSGSLADLNSKLSSLRSGSGAFNGAWLVFSKTHKVAAYVTNAQASEVFGTLRSRNT